MPSFSGGEDYDSLNEELTFTSTDEQRQCVTIRALQDDVVEAIEFFTVTLQNPVGIAVGNDQTLVTIDQDDSDGKIDKPCTTMMT